MGQIVTTRIVTIVKGFLNSAPVALATFVKELVRGLAGMEAFIMRATMTRHLRSEAFIIRATLPTALGATHKF